MTSFSGRRYSLMLATIDTTAIDRITRLIPGYDPWATAAEGDWFDYETAIEKAAFFPGCLTHQRNELAGRPIHLEEWQLAIIYNLFGWMRADGIRRYREAYITVARGNGKSTLCVGIAGLLLYADAEPGAEVYAAAAERGQANRLLRDLKGMVRTCPELLAASQIFQHRITFPENHSFFESISSEARSKHGFDLHGAVIDELHAIRDRELVDVLETSRRSRKQPLIVHITTAGYDKTSICFEKYEYALRVRDGVTPDRAFLPVIYEVPKDDDWQDESNWIKANPNIGVSLKWDYMREQAAHAATTPAFENVFRRLHLNQWTEQAERILPMHRWDECAEPFDEESLEGRPCYGGLDMSTTTDISAFVLVFPPEQEGGDYYCLFRCWVPEEHPRCRARHEMASYAEWIKSEHMLTTPGDVVDYERVRAEIADLGTRFDIRGIAVDRWNTTQMQTALLGDGFEVVKFAQGFAAFNAPTKALIELVLGRRIAHGGHPVARWCASNLAADINAEESMKPTKKKSSDRIDLAVALIMGLDQAMLNEGGGDDCLMWVDDS